MDEYDEFIYKHIVNPSLKLKAKKTKSKVDLESGLEPKKLYPFGFEATPENEDNKLIVLNCISEKSKGTLLHHIGFNEVWHEKTGFSFYVKITDEDSGGYNPYFKVEVVLEEEMNEKIEEIQKNIKAFAYLLF